ncbi:YtpI family protein [Paenibacillus agricola]|uniref:YtpI-like protein n=1 Tax=Paenibacillus agricola TaxID=2716264 RepID=A0ABX0JBL1_9BACL|nr:YtpI family protein [Paenibacillus agricola]NHN31569.1 hypothetical protein [Paenibacillus agricola]
MQTIQTILFALLVVTLVMSVYYSFRSRKQIDPKLRGIYSSRTNIMMGLMLIIIAITQLFFFTDSNTRRVFGVICFLLGAFNLFAGLRNHSHFNRQ